MTSLNPCGHGQIINNTLEINNGYYSPVPYYIQKERLYHPRELLEKIKNSTEINYEFKTMIKKEMYPF